MIGFGKLHLDVGPHEPRAGIRIFETSAKTGAGMDEWLGYLAEARENKG
jgi:Ni2+-binding GTPase involved in maturation of urease and hydrogenase